MNLLSPVLLFMPNIPATGGRNSVLLCNICVRKCVMLGKKQQINYTRCFWCASRRYWYRCLSQQVSSGCWLDAELLYILCWRSNYILRLFYVHLFAFPWTVYRHLRTWLYPRMQECKKRVTAKCQTYNRSKKKCCEVKSKDSFFRVLDKRESQDEAAVESQRCFWSSTLLRVHAAQRIWGTATEIEGRLGTQVSVVQILPGKNWCSRKGHRRFPILFYHLGKEILPPHLRAMPVPYTGSKDWGRSVNWKH